MKEPVSNRRPPEVDLGVGVGDGCVVGANDDDGISDEEIDGIIMVEFIVMFIIDVVAIMEDAFDEMGKLLLLIMEVLYEADAG